MISEIKKYLNEKNFPCGTEMVYVVKLSGSNGGIKWYIGRCSDRKRLGAYRRVGSYIRKKEDWLIVDRWEWAVYNCERVESFLLADFNAVSDDRFLNKTIGTYWGPLETYKKTRDPWYIDRYNLALEDIKECVN